MMYSICERHLLSFVNVAMFVWSLSLYNIIEVKVSFFYAKSRTCSFIAILLKMLIVKYWIVKNNKMFYNDVTDCNIKTKKFQYS